jgi:hypothetical protein
MELQSFKPTTASLFECGVQIGFLCGAFFGTQLAYDEFCRNPKMSKVNQVAGTVVATSFCGITGALLAVGLAACFPASLSIVPILGTGIVHMMCRK